MLKCIQGSYKIKRLALKDIAQENSWLVLEIELTGSSRYPNYLNTVCTALGIEKQYSQHSVSWAEEISSTTKMKRARKMCFWICTSFMFLDTQATLEVSTSNHVKHFQHLGFSGTLPVFRQLNSLMLLPISHITSKYWWTIRKQRFTNQKSPSTQIHPSRSSSFLGECLKHLDKGIVSEISQRKKSCSLVLTCIKHYRHLLSPCIKCAHLIPLGLYSWKSEVAQMSSHDF